MCSMTGLLFHTGHLRFSLAQWFNGDIYNSSSININSSDLFDRWSRRLRVLCGAFSFRMRYPAPVVQHAT